MEQELALFVYISLLFSKENFASFCELLIKSSSNVILHTTSSVCEQYLVLFRVHKGQVTTEATLQGQWRGSDLGGLNPLYVCTEL